MLEALKFFGKSFYFLTDSKHESFSAFISGSKVDYSTQFVYFREVGKVFLK